MSRQPAPSPFRVSEFLDKSNARALHWGQPFLFQERTNSTNDEALQAARRGAPSGSVFFAEHQTQGRGRQGKTWLSEPGQSLLFSVLLRPDQAIAHYPTITLAAGLGVRAALAKHLPQSTSLLKLKWPNDIVVQPGASPERDGDQGTHFGLKIAGILCEGQLTGSRLQAVVLGVGLNVLNLSLPEGLETQATSLVRLGASTQVNRETLLVDILDAMHARIAPGFSPATSKLLGEFRCHDALSDTEVCVTSGQDQRLYGIAQGVDEQGLLLLKTTDGIVPIRSGTVRPRG